MGSGFFHHQAKKVRKTLISTFLCLLLDFLDMKTDVNVPSKSTKQKVWKKKLFVGILSASDEKSRIRNRNRIRKLVVWSRTKMSRIQERWFSVVCVIQVGDNCWAARGFCLRSPVGSWEDFLPQVNPSRKMESSRLEYFVKENCLTRWIWLLIRVSDQYSFDTDPDPAFFLG